MRRTIDEIATLYELEPVTRKDVYVEGVDDRDLLGWSFEQLRQSGRSVFCICDIEVPANIIDELGLSKGSNRDRVVALAQSIWKVIDRAICTLSFVVDLDLARFYRGQLVPDGVLTTDFPAVECYLFNDEIVDTFLRVHCRIDQERANRLRKSVLETCTFLYALRVVLVSFPIPAKIVGVQQLLQLNMGRLELDRGSIVQRTLSTAGKLADRELVEFAIEEVLVRIHANGLNALHFTHGHDALQLLGETVKLQVGDSAYRDEKRVRRSLLMALRIEMLSEFPLFKKLLT